jgi:hypothetical protein
MPTIALGRAETRTISISAPPADVFAYLSDPRHLPAWAPAFATAVTHEQGDIWRVQSGAGERRTAVRAAWPLGVVDIVSPEGPSRGLFARVIPNLSGSELIFSLSFPAGASPDQIEAQMATIERELIAVRQRVEGRRDEVPASRQPVHSTTHGGAP